MSDSWLRPEREAEAVLKKFKVQEAPVPVEAIADELGAWIERKPRSPAISGLLYRENGRAIIVVNGDDPPVRQRFTVAHELGHLQLHAGDKVSIDRDLRVNARANDQPHNQEEVEANRFAAALLMPEGLVRSVGQEISQRSRLTDESLVGELAKRFDVSREAMKFRLANLGLLTSL